MNYLLLIIGLVLLSKGADFLIDGASALARRFGVPCIIIGLTIVAVGTSLPEFLVNVTAAARGSTDLALGNIIGSNLANTLLILGVVALIHPPSVQRATVWKEIPFALYGALALLVLANDRYLDGITPTLLTRADGIILLLFMAIFIYYLIEIALERKEPPLSAEACDIILPPGRIVLYLLVGILALYLGGRWVVGSAVNLAQNFGLSEYLISATIISIGTSLPELVTSYKAARRRETDLAIGNIVGSNIFNIFWVLGVTAIIAPIPTAMQYNFDILYLVGASFLLFLFMFVGKRHQFEQWQGAVFIAGYAIYLAVIIARG